MKHYSGLAFRELRSQKVTSILIILALILSTLMTSAIALSLPIVQKLLQEQLKVTQGNYHFQIHNPKKPENVYANTDFESIGLRRTLGSATIGKTGMLMNLESDDAIARSMSKGSFDVVKGRLPEKIGEIALEERDFDTFGISKEIGQQINVTYTITQSSAVVSTKTKSFYICGILAPCIKYMSVEGHLGLVSEAETAQGEIQDSSYYIQLKSPKILEDKSYLTQIQSQYHLDEVPSTNNELLRSMFIFPDGVSPADFWAEWIPLGIVGIMVLFAAGLVIYNIMKISIIKKMQQYGTLRALGASKPQVYKILLYYVMTLSAIAIPIGLFLGSFISHFLAQVMARRWAARLAVDGLGSDTKVLDALVNQHFFISVPVMLLSAGISLFFVLIATLPSICHVASVSPVVAMTGWQPNLKRKRGKKAKTIYSVEKYLAFTNLSRNKGRTVITILSMVISITVVIALGCYVNLKESQQLYNRASQGTFAMTAPIGNVILMDTDETLNALPKAFQAEDIAAIKQSSPGCNITCVSYVVLEKNWHGTATPFPASGSRYTIHSCNDDALRHLAPDLNEDALRKLREGNACLFKRTGNKGSEDFQKKVEFFQQGDVISAGGKDYSLLYDLNFEPEAQHLYFNAGQMNGLLVYIHENQFNKNFGMHRKYYSNVTVFPGKGADLNAVWAAIQKVAEKYPGTAALDWRPQIASIRDNLKMMKLFGYLLVALVALVGIFNIASTTYTNIHTRVKEIGTLRALGMNGKSLYRSFLWEGVFYGLFSAVFGVLLGGGASLVQLTSSTGKNIFSNAVMRNMPWGSILVACAVAIAICLLSVYIPLQSIKKKNIVDSLEFME